MPFEAYNVGVAIRVFPTRGDASLSIKFKGKHGSLRSNRNLTNEWFTTETKLDYNGMELIFLLFWPQIEINNKIST